MSLKIDPADRKILTVAGAILLALIIVAAIVAPSQPSQTGYPSSYSAASDGAKAAYMLLRDMGYSVQRSAQSPEDLKNQAGNSVLVLAEPFVAATESERAALRKFLEDGGKVLAVGASASSMLPIDGAHLGIPQFQWKKSYAKIPSALTYGADEISMAAGTVWREDGEHFSVVHFSEAAGDTVISYAWGKGEVIWWASSVPLSNAGISTKGNLALFLNSIGPAASHDIIWDEYFHGHTKTLWSSLSATPLVWAVAQAALMGLAVMMTFSRRHGPVRAMVQKSRLSPLEFVETLGELYQRANAAPIAVEVAFRRFRNLLTRRLQLPHSASSLELSQGVKGRLGYDEARLQKDLEKCERISVDADVSEDEALVLAQSLHRVSVELKLVKEEGHSIPKEEKQ